MIAAISQKKQPGFLPCIHSKRKAITVKTEELPKQPQPPSQPRSPDSAPRQQDQAATKQAATPSSPNSSSAPSVQAPQAPLPPPSTRRHSIVLRHRIFGVGANITSPRLPPISSLQLRKDSVAPAALDAATLQQLQQEADRTQEEAERQRQAKKKMKHRMKRSLQRYVTENKINLENSSIEGEYGIDPVDTMTFMYTYSFGTQNDCFDEYDTEGKLPNYFIAQDADMYEEVFDVKLVQAKNLLALHYYANRVRKELNKIFG